MNHRRAVLLGVALFAIALPACESDKKEAATQEAPLTYESAIDASVTAKVKAINQATRVMTIEDTSGHWITFTVDDKVKRLSEVMVGDNVRAQYRATLLAELRAPTPDESPNSITVTETQQRAPGAMAPRHATSQETKVVAVVEAVDVPKMLVTLRGPMGDRAVVRGRKAENIKKIHVGDTIVMTFTETVAVGLERIAPR